MERSLSEREKVVFESAGALFKISKDLIEIDPHLSKTILYLSDRVLRIIEPVDSVGSGPPVGSVKHATPDGCEICTDCGGVKTPIPGLGSAEVFKMPIAGTGTGNLVQPLGEMEKITPLESIDDETDESKLCHGHTGDGSGLDPNYKPGAQIMDMASPKENIKNEVKGLVDKIRKDLS